MDNVFFKLLWCLLKHEDIYLQGDDREAHSGVAAWFTCLATGRRWPWARSRPAPIGGKAVDMMDSARALPTRPQRQQQRWFANVSCKFENLLVITRQP
jgi:hypothetical protein